MITSQFMENKNYQPMFTPTADSHQVLPDGRVVQIARKGCPMPMADAIRFGLVGDGTPESIEGYLETAVGNTRLTAQIQEHAILKNDSRQQSLDQHVAAMQGPGNDNKDLIR